MLLVNSFVIIALPPARRLRFLETFRSTPFNSPRAGGPAPWPAIAAVLVFLSGLAFAAEPTFTVVPDHATGVYSPNEKVTWTVDVKGDRTGLTALPYKVKADAQTLVTSGTIDVSTGPATISATRGDPGALLAEVASMDKTKMLPLAMGGALISPEKIAPAAPAPQDFGAFWDAKLKELDAIPLNPQLEKVNVDALKYANGIECDKVTLDNIRGTHARGIFAKPARSGTFPAMLMVNFAGVYPLDKGQVIVQAQPGWLVLNISAHDLPVDETDAYYKDLKANALKDYMYIGSESRETSYFLRMLLGCVRGAEYLASRPDWDGKTLVVTGVSQGGLQSFATAALYPKISAVMTMVPAGCDNYGPLGHPPRAFGWPYWLSPFGPKGRDMKKVQETAGYFDGIYFASRIHCPTLVAVALLDVAARPAGVLAAYNSINAPKELVIMPTSNHYGNNGGGVLYFNRFSKWKQALQKHEPLPIPPLQP